jgi:hypothetical protein
MKKLIYALMLLALLLLPARSAFAWNHTLDGRIIVGRNFLLKSGDTLDGDLVVIGGEATIENGATVNGDLVLIGGSLKLDGQVSGNAVVIGGTTDMGEKSQIGGDVVTVGGSLQRAEGAEIGGNIVTNLSPAANIPAITIPSNPANPPVVPEKPQTAIRSNPFAEIFGILAQAILIAILGMALILFVHPQLDRVAQTVTAQPFVSGTIGLLTAFLAPIILAVLAIFTFTIILAPITLPLALVLFILLGLAWLFGIISIGVELGDRFTKAIHQTWAPVLSAGLGTFSLALLVGALGYIPCIGWMAGAIIGLMGTGAVVMTAFGTRPASGLGMNASTRAPAAASDTIIPPTS